MEIVFKQYIQKLEHLQLFVLLGGKSCHSNCVSVNVALRCFGALFYIRILVSNAEWLFLG